MKPTTEQIQQKAEAYALRKWGYSPECTNIEVLYMDTAVVNNSKEDFTAGAEWMAGEAHQRDAWISVQDRLPYKDGDSEIFCLVWDTYEGHAVVRPYNEYHKCWDGEDADDFYTDATEGNISHWQPLPSPPQTESK